MYTLTGFYICFPLQYSPLISIYNFHICKLSLPSFSHFHTSYIPHFSTVSIVFPAPPFRCPHFRLPIIPFCLPSINPPVWYFLIPCHFLSYHQSHLPALPPELSPPPPHKNVTRSHSPLCCIALARGHRETAKTCADIVGYFNSVCPQCNSIRKMTSRSAFLMCRTRTGGHSSKYWPSERLLDLGDSLAPTTHRILSVLILKYVLRNFWNSINQHCKIPKSKIQKFQCFKNSY